MVSYTSVTFMDTNHPLTTDVDSLPGGRSEIEDFLSSETVNSFLQTLLSCLVGVWHYLAMTKLT